MSNVSRSWPPVSVRLAAMALLVVLGQGPLAALAAEPGADAPTDEQIGRWVENLTHEQYRVRQDATRRLSRAGLRAVAAVAGAARDGNLETASRAVEILSHLMASSDAAVEEAAAAALEELAAQRLSSVADLAAGVLVNRSAVQRVRALAEIQRLGATINYITWYENDGMVSQRPAQIIINKEWKGGDAGLAHLRYITDAQRLSLYNPDVTAAALDHLRQFRAMQHLDLYGTAFTEKQVETLKQALPQLTVDFRKGALLGIHALDHEKGCLVDNVQEGSAAAKAGLQVQDVITQFDGQPVVGFAGLTAFISQKAGGEKVKLTVLRNEKTMELEATLGAWGE